jgi:hypothetical protein
MDVPRVARQVMDAADAIGRRMGYVERRTS